MTAWRAKVGLSRYGKDDVEEVRVEPGQIVPFEPPAWLIEQGLVEEVPDAPAPKKKGKADA